MSKIIAGRMLVDDDELHFRDDDAQKKLKDLIVQSKGDAEDKVMSQAAATKEFDKLSEEIAKNKDSTDRITEGVFQHSIYDWSTLYAGYDGWWMGYYTVEDGERVRNNSTNFICTMKEITLKNVVKVRVTPPVGCAVEIIAYKSNGTHEIIGNANSSKYPEEIDAIRELYCSDYVSIDLSVGHLSGNAGELAQTKDFINSVVLEMWKETPKNSIISLNPCAEYLLTQALRPFNGSDKDAYLSQPKPLVLLHFTDIHGDTVELERVIEFYKHYRDYIDDVISTGDNVIQNINDGFDFWKNTEDVHLILNTIGNHDSYYTNKYGDKVPQTDLYNTFFADYINEWGVTYQEGKTYYYKDYSESDIRLVVLNSYLLNGTDDAEQKIWFDEVLADALTKKLSVVIAQHHPITILDKIDCAFSTLDYTSNSQSNDLLPKYMTSVDTFKNNGGKFVCWLTGHWHWDTVGVNRDYTNQLCIVTDSLSRAQGNNYSDTQRTDGMKSQDLFNITIIDTSSNAVKIIRVGADTDRYLRKKDVLCVNYDTCTVIK